VKVDEAIEIVQFARSELARVAEIDRSERIDTLVEQQGERLVERRGGWDAPAWDRGGSGEHSVRGKVHELEGYLDLGGTALAALVGDRLVGLGVVVPGRRPGVAQLAFLHVTAESRGCGIGRQLAESLERLARESGAQSMVVSATPTGNTVRFYMGIGFQPIAEPLRELVELEPEDIHMSMTL
jgi:GNAT superfamily N-acetyltransferase